MQIKIRQVKFSQCGGRDVETCFKHVYNQVLIFHRADFGQNTTQN